MKIIQSGWLTNRIGVQGFCVVMIALCSPFAVVAQHFEESFDSFDESAWTQADRGELSVRDGVLSLKDCYVHAGDLSWKDYELEFRARAPEDADTVRIFAGFRYNSDQNRYVFGLRGGNNNDLFLARYGDRNKHAFLGTAPLGFIPEKGVWYTLRIRVEESSIQIFLNDEPDARMTVLDAGAPFASGKIALGGGWSKTEFDSVKVSPLSSYEIHADARRYNFQVLSDPAVDSWQSVGHNRYTKEKGIGWNDGRLFALKRNLSGNSLFDSLVGFGPINPNFALTETQQANPATGPINVSESKVLLTDLPDGDYVVSLELGDPSHRSKNRVFFMDELQPSINSISREGESNLLRKSIRTYGGKLRMRFEIDELGVGCSVNWMAIETRQQAGEAAWKKYLTFVQNDDLAEKEMLRKSQRAAYQKLTIDPPKNGRTVTSLNGDWLFLPDYEAGNIKPWETSLDDSSWHVMDVPNFWTPMLSWNYYEGEGRGSRNLWEKERARCAAYTFNAEKAKTGYYRHTLILPENLNGKTVQIQFNAIGREAELWVNGTSVKSRTGMFAPLRTDISAFVQSGENVIVLRAGDSIKMPDYNTRDAGIGPIHLMFSGNRGIWQDVSLEIADQLTIDDTFFKPQLNRFDLEVTVTNRSSSPIEYKLAAQIRDHKSKRLVYDHVSSSRTALKTGAQTGAFTVLTNDESKHAPFKNWSPEFPNLYTAEVFAYHYNSDPSVNVTQFSKKAVKLNLNELNKQEVFSTNLANGEYVLTLQFGHPTEPSLAEAYIGRNVTDIHQAIVRDFCKPGEFITVLKSLTVENGKLELTIPRLPAPGAPTVLHSAVVEKRSDVSDAKWNLGLNHFNVLDNVAYNAGFRTFAVDGEDLVLNGKPFKLRGATMTPNSVRPNDKPLAEWFMKTLHENNISVTKNHASPFNKIWLNAADEAGVGLSQEGIWVWLMLYSKPIPSEEMLNLWKDEYIAILNMQKNHPSLLWLTHNSEMKLWITNEPRRYEIHSDAVKEFRKVDPTRPVVADTGYARGYLDRMGGKRPDIDDGDIDDSHLFYNWYNPNNFFYMRDGKVYTDGMRSPGRPYTSNEFATGYPDPDAGHAIKHYIYQHYVPQALVGKWCYEDRDPKYWLKRLALINKESHESVRTSYRDTAAGMMIFSLVTWFQNMYDVETITPYSTLASVAKALEPVMVSAQLGGRNFYAGSSHTVNSVVVNDSPLHETLSNIYVDWEVSYEGKALSSGKQRYSGTLDYYKNKDEAFTFTLPETLPQARVNAELVLKLHANSRTISTNSYDIVVCDSSFAKNSSPIRVGYFTQNDRLSPVLSKLGVTVVPVKDLSQLDAKAFDVLLLADLSTKPAGYEKLIEFANAGGKLLLSENKDFAVQLLPGELTGRTELSKEIVTPCAYHKSIFDGIEPDDLCWFTGTETWKESPNFGHVPIACRSAYNANDLPHVTRLAETTKIHGYHYRDSDTYHPKNTFDEIHGYPLVEIQKGTGRIIVSSMCLDAVEDPIAGKLLSNLISYLKE